MLQGGRAYTAHLPNTPTIILVLKFFVVQWWELWWRICCQSEKQKPQFSDILDFNSVMTENLITLMREMLLLVHYSPRVNKVITPDIFKMDPLSGNAPNCLLLMCNGDANRSIALPVTSLLIWYTGLVLVLMLTTAITLIRCQPKITSIHSNTIGMSEFNNYLYLYSEWVEINQEVGMTD